MSSLPVLPLVTAAADDILLCIVGFLLLFATLNYKSPLHSWRSTYSSVYNCNSLLTWSFDLDTAEWRQSLHTILRLWCGGHWSAPGPIKYNHQCLRFLYMEPPGGDKMFWQEDNCPISPFLWRKLSMQIIQHLLNCDCCFNCHSWFC